MLWKEALGFFGIGDEGIITCVGAGGKSSLLMSLAAQWRQEGKRFLLTTTTKMFYYQVDDFAPFFCGDYNKGAAMALDTMNERGYAAWLWEETGGKIRGLPPAWIDSFYKEELLGRGSVSGKGRIIVEGDGARQKPLKIPGDDEPIVPRTSAVVLGVLGLQAWGEKFSPSLVHRFELVGPLLGKKEGEIIEEKDYAVLGGNQRGIFKGCPGKKILVLTGTKTVASGRQAMKAIGKEIEERRSGFLEGCILTKGFGKEMEPVELLRLK